MAIPKLTPAEIIYLALFALCIPVASFMMANIGTTCDASGVCLLPIYPGLLMPSGLVALAPALVLQLLFDREEVREQMLVIPNVVGVLLASVVAPISIAFAYAITYALSEAQEALIDEPLKARDSLALAFVARTLSSLLFGALFLYVAFGSTKYLMGYFIGQFLVSLAVVPFGFLIKNARRP